MQEKYQKEFILFKDELKSFLFRLLTVRQDTEDIAHDTFIKAFKNLDSFNKNSTFKTWVFTIAINLAKDKLSKRKQWTENWMDYARDAHIADSNLMQKKHEIATTSEHGKFEIREHINFCFTCINKSLLLTNQICLLLKEIYAFKVKEIMLITDLSEGKIKHAIANGRNDMKRIFKNRCALINKKGVCNQCSGLNNVFNPEQNTQIEVNKIKMVKESEKRNYEQLFDLRIQLAKSIDPLNANGTDLHSYLLENFPTWAKLQTVSTKNNLC